jgi:outer membrane protein insertion porin family
VNRWRASAVKAEVQTSLHEPRGSGRESAPFFRCDIPPLKMEPTHVGCHGLLGLIFGWRLIALIVLLVAMCASAAEGPAAPEPKPAGLKISGYGFLGQFRLKQMLRLLQVGETRPEYFDANYIEDAVLLLASHLGDEGYLRPVITADLTLEDEDVVSYVWDEPVEEPLPRPLAVRAVRFRIEKGVLYHFEKLEFTGLQSIPEKKARSYFIETGGLFSLKRNRTYSPDALKRSADNLADQLHQLGFQNASVVATNLSVDAKTGRVVTRVEVREGPRFIVRSVSQQVYFGTATEPAESRTNHPGQPYSKVWEQDYAQGVRTNYFRQGYPDTAMDIRILGRTVATNEVLLDLNAVVKTGLRIRVGEVGFTGNKRTRDEVLERRLPLNEGDWLNRIRAEQGRYRLSRLGVFDSVQLKYEPVDEQTRNLTYELNEGKQIDVSLLFGYGSYELLRGGVQLDQYNVLGRAHHQRLKLVQSFKSSNADYTYTMPEFFGENMDVFFTGSGLRREEVSFTRLEYGGGAGIRKYFRNLHTDVSTRYNYQILEARDADSDLEEVGLRNSRAAAIITDINHDRRDNPLYPRRGYKLFANFEIASDYLGGDVDYQRLDFAAAWHWPVSDAQWVHAGFSHGLVAAIGDTAEDLPFNRRFFPGGENSVRGFQEGEASPRNADGKIVGAETYLLGNVEFEQGLTPKWSVVGFVDAVGFAQQLQDYPVNETLVSAGGGLRWKTFIGPVRVEYGHNLNPRRGDPAGTLHFSLGFPF